MTPLNEKQIKELVENIVESVVAASLGKEPNLLSNAVFKTIADHPNYALIKSAVIAYLHAFDGKVESTEEWKRLSDFRFQLVGLYQVNDEVVL